MHPPTLLTRRPGDPVPGTRVISARVSDQMRRLMRLVVEHGTGKNGDAPGYLVGGKTGTAEKLMDGRYQRDALISSFVAAFPITRPRYVIVVMLDEPKGIEESFGFATGGWTAAPVVAHVVARMAPLMGVAPVDEDAPEVRRRLAVRINARDPRVANF
ncbi:MAG: penicillin-binding transpeptidase domain-containing protein, partial [Alphaproteobacteria bacterium]